MGGRLKSEDFFAFGPDLGIMNQIDRCCVAHGSHTTTCIQVYRYYLFSCMLYVQFAVPRTIIPHRFLKTATSTTHGACFFWVVLFPQKFDGRHSEIYFYIALISMNDWVYHRLSGR